MSQVPSQCFPLATIYSVTKWGGLESGGLKLDLYGSPGKQI